MEEYIFYAGLSGLTFLILIILLIVICIKEKNTFNKFFLILLCISEMFNCIPKFLQIFRKDKKDDILCYLQVLFSLTSDIGTLTTTTLMSIKACDDYSNSGDFFKKKRNQNFLKIINIVFPFIFFFFIFFRKSYDNQCWVKGFYSNLFIYIIFWILILTNFFFLRRVMCELCKMRKQYKEFEKDLLEEGNLSIKSEKLRSKKISGKLYENYIYSIIIPLIWVYFTFSRLKQMKKEEEEKDIFMEIHMFISSGRGIIYVLIYLINNIYIKCIK